MKTGSLWIDGESGPNSSGRKRRRCRVLGVCASPPGGLVGPAFSTRESWESEATRWLESGLSCTDIMHRHDEQGGGMLALSLLVLSHHMPAVCPSYASLCRSAKDFEAPTAATKPPSQRHQPSPFGWPLPPEVDFEGRMSGGLPNGVRTTRHVAAANGVLPGVHEAVPFLPDVPLIAHERLTWENRARQRISSFESVEVTHLDLKHRFPLDLMLNQAYTLEFRLAGPADRCPRSS